jgi:hypothetical protein
MGLEIELVAASGARRGLFLPLLKAFCGKKICIVSNGFLSDVAWRCAEV